MKTPCSFVDHIWEVFGPLLAGCSTVLLPKVLLLQPGALAAALVTHKVTHYVGLQQCVSDILYRIAEREAEVK